MQHLDTGNTLIYDSNGPVIIEYQTLRNFIELGISSFEFYTTKT